MGSKVSQSGHLMSTKPSNRSRFLFLHITMFVLPGAKSGIKSVPKWTQYEDIIQHQVGIPAGQSALGGATLVPVSPNKRWVPRPPFLARNYSIKGPKLAGQQIHYFWKSFDGIKHQSRPSPDRKNVTSSGGPDWGICATQMDEQYPP